MFLNWRPGPGSNVCLIGVRVRGGEGFRVRGGDLGYVEVLGAGPKLACRTPLAGAPNV